MKRPQRAAAPLLWRAAGWAAVLAALGVIALAYRQPGLREAILYSGLGLC